MTDAEPGSNILTLNSGSSSLKFGLYRVGSARTEMLLSGEAESIGDEKGKFYAQDSRENALLSETVSIPSQREAIIRIAKLLADSKMPAPAAIGHRIVHGGPKLRQHCLIDDSVLQQVEAVTAFAPQHIPAALSVIRFAQEHFPGPPQVACFDATFHAELAEVARLLPISKELQLEGVQRYGFHGLSCESILHQLANDLPNRLVIAHLGNGASRRIGGGRTCPSDLQGIAIGGYPTLRVSRPFVRIDLAPTCKRSAEPPSNRPSRQWRKRHRGQRRQIDRHQHGIDANRRGDHGHAQRRSRSGRSGLSDA